MIKFQKFQIKNLCPQSWGFFMFRTEIYQIFKNSKDFEKIFRRSHPEIQKNLQFSMSDFVEKFVKPAIHTNTIILAYFNNEVIGYQLLQINNRILSNSFTYIDEKYRKQGFGSRLRYETYLHFKHRFDKVYAMIYDKNKSSIISCEKLANKMGFDLKEEKKVYDESGIPIASIYKVQINE